MTVPLKFAKMILLVPTGSSGNPVKFNANGDSLGRYDIYQFQGRENDYKYVKIGEWLDR